MNQLGELASVVPLSLYAKPSHLRDALTYYKPGRETYEPQLAIALAKILSEFMAKEGDSLADFTLGWTDIVIVSSVGRGSRHPLERVAEMAGLETASDVLFPTSQGRHRQYSRSLFEAASGISGRRVLLLEDVYVSGARSQSAAYCLRAAGAVPVAILCLGRRVNPSWNSSVASFWDRHVSGASVMVSMHRWLSLEVSSDAA